MIEKVLCTQLLEIEKFTLLPAMHFIDDSRFFLVYNNTTSHMFASASLARDDVESITTTADNVIKMCLPIMYYNS